MQNQWIDISYCTAPHNLFYTISLLLKMMTEKEHMQHGVTNAPDNIMLKMCCVLHSWLYDYYTTVLSSLLFIVMYRTQIIIICYVKVHSGLKVPTIKDPAKK